MKKRFFLSNCLPLFITLFFLITPLTGCSFLQDTEKLQKEKEKAEHKRQLYDDLLDRINSGDLQTGIPMKDILEKYEEPDDKFQTGTMTGSFQIWTYERVIEQDDAEFHAPIRLYFDNGKLVSWKY